MLLFQQNIHTMTTTFVIPSATCLIAGVVVPLIR